MLSILDNLDENQKQVVTFRDGAMLAVAGPGAGKTACLTRRMAYLIQHGVQSRRILMITFTKTAAEEMSSRVCGFTGISQDVLSKNIMTFHSLGARIILSCSWALKHKLAEPKPINPSKCRTILQKICGEAQMKYATARNYISIQKRHDVDSLQAKLDAAEEHDLVEVRLATVYELYEINKQAAGLFDFDDLLFYSGRLLRDNQRARDRWQAAFDYVMVDEFPDTDLAQMRLIDTIVKPRGNIVVVGDGNQSIFQWRGGDYTLFTEFEEWYPNCQKVFLGRNYRSLPNIVDTYKKMITGAPSVIKGFLESIAAHRQGECEVQKWTCADDADEASRVATDLKEQICNEPSGTYAIIVRTNKQMCVFEGTLTAQAIPYVIVGSSSFFNRPEIRQVIAYLRVVDNPTDDEALTSVILGRSTLTKYLGKAYVELLKASKGCMWDALPSTGKPWQRRKGQEVQDFFEQIQREYDELHVADQLKVIVQRAGILSVLADEEELDEIDNSVEENIEELIRAAAKYDSRDKFLSYVDAMATKPSRESAPVKMLTVHRAKGQEYDVVYVCGFNDDILPHKRAEDVEEERRIAYVAVSRAKDELVISSYGNNPSRFLKYLHTGVESETEDSPCAN